MRDFFIKWLERVINILIIIGAVAVVLTGFGAMVSAPYGAGSGLITALTIWVGGGIYLILTGGIVYLGLGVYNNTLRTAEATERQADHGA